MTAVRNGIQRALRELHRLWDRSAEKAFATRALNGCKDETARGEFISALIVERGSGLAWAKAPDGRRKAR
jgi:hypothetical protein